MIPVSKHPLDVKGVILEEIIKAKPSNISGKKSKTIKIQQMPSGYLGQSFVALLCLNSIN